MTLFPFFEDIEGKHFLIIGGGKVAAGKAGRLLPFTENITMIAPDAAADGRLSDEREADRKGRNDPLPEGIRIYRRPFQWEDLSDADIVIAATNDHVLNRQIALACRERHIPVDIADAPDLCTFIFPSLISRGDLTIGISTNGKSPAYSRLLRQQIEEMLPEHIDLILSKMGQLRTWMAGQDIFAAQPQRRAFYREALAKLLETDGAASLKELEQVALEKRQTKQA